MYLRGELLVPQVLSGYLFIIIDYINKLAGDLYNQPDDCKYLYYYINRFQLLPYVYIIPRFDVVNNRNNKKLSQSIFIKPN
jgi:hypothetical protein|nr:MAG TPA_asm: hypothetical protein [Caudoviricetes sp.]